jgi:hypothetical protein
MVLREARRHDDKETRSETSTNEKDWKYQYHAYRTLVGNPWWEGPGLSCCWGNTVWGWKLLSSGTLHCLILSPWWGDSMHLWNVGELLLDYTVHHPKSHLHTRRRENLKSHQYFILVLRGIRLILKFSYLHFATKTMQIFHVYTHH